MGFAMAFPSVRQVHCVKQAKLISSSKRASEIQQASEYIRFQKLEELIRNSRVRVIEGYGFAITHEACGRKKETKNKCFIFSSKGGRKKV